MSEILFMAPVFKQMIWGGNKLASKWGYEIPGENTGECWAVSAHPNGDCTVKEGTFAGKTLSQLWAEEPQLFGGAAGDRFPLLIKIIDANDDLSIQVHPDDTYAGKNENGSFGKTECWYILDAPEGATLVIGHNAKDKAELEDMIQNGRWEDFLREVPVKKGILFRLIQEQFMPSRAALRFWKRSRTRILHIVYMTMDASKMASHANSTLQRALMLSQFPQSLWRRVLSIFPQTRKIL